MCPQSLLSPRRTTIALTNAANVIMLAHMSTMMPVIEVCRELPGTGRSRSSPPPPPGGRCGRVGGGPPRLDWVSVRAMILVSPIASARNSVPAQGRTKVEAPVQPRFGGHNLRVFLKSGALSDPDRPNPTLATAARTRQRNRSPRSPRIVSRSCPDKSPDSRWRFFRVS